MAALLGNAKCAFRKTTLTNTNTNTNTNTALTDGKHYLESVLFAKKISFFLLLLTK